MKLYRALIIGLSLFLIGCESNGHDEWYEEDYSSEEDYSNLEEDEEEGHLLRYTITKGQEQFDSGKLDIEMRATDQAIYLTVEIDLGDSVVFPMAYNKEFHQKEEASHFGVRIKFESGKEQFTVAESESMHHDGKVTLYYKVLPSDFRHVSAGLHDFNLTIEGKFSSFFGYEAKGTPIFAEARLSYKVPDVYKSTFYFKALKLDKESVIALLGDNDGFDGTPEPGIYVTYHNQRITDGYASNSFAYKEKLKADFYHLSPNDTIVVEVIDKDYFLNIDDNINEIWLPLKDLESETYKKYSMEHVEELLVYCKQHGKAN